MKKVLPAFLLFFCIVSLRLFSLDLELSGGLGNLAFSNDRISSLGAGDEGFEPNLFPIVFAQLSGEWKGLACNVGFEREDLLRNRLFANVKATFNYFYLEGGTVFGVFNSSRLPINPGISAGLGLVIPGIIFAQVSGSSSLGILMDTPDSYIQRTGDISLGFWVPYVICSLNMDIRYFAQREKKDLLIEDQLIRYYFSADVYTKNIPFGIRLDLGYQNLSRSYTGETDKLRSIFMGLEASYTLNESLKFMLGGEMPVYSWAVKPMQNPSRSDVMFEARAGFVWTILQ